MPTIQQSQRATRLLNKALHCCIAYRHEFVSPEHMLWALLDDERFCTLLSEFGDEEHVRDRLLLLLEETESIPADIGEYQPELSTKMQELLQRAYRQVESSSAEAIDIPHLVNALLELDDCWAAYFLRDAIGEDVGSFLNALLVMTAFEGEVAFGTTPKNNKGDGDETDASAQKEPWRLLVTCLNDTYRQHNRLIGREAELERTMQVLCRKDKNNPLHVGEPGVGKTALVYGLAQRIEEGMVPQKLAGCRIYQLELGTLLAGTQYRGDFENRIKMIMDGAAAEGNAIVYIDEIHNIVGAGSVGESSMDASNMLKPYLEAGNIRFIGSTTYEEYNKHFARSRGLVRRFQQIDIPEPSVDEAIEILKGLRTPYETFHGITVDDDIIDYIVRTSAKHIADRFLPDKAIDLLDEAGAALAMHPSEATKPRITKELVSELLAKTCKVNALAIKEDDDNAALQTLEPRLLKQIYGQDEAVRQVVEAVQMAKAGLLDEQKPIASLLFVGPTGVGKTEVARVLAKEMGIELVRFDMSEYTEKHTVAKLIGSPAGYVGYEDGGLLTDAIRKTPNCVLLLDEIEKAHSDIYNILLQVMDYARLTDNKGRKADFRNVILIMTSNAGAQYASQASIGFEQKTTAGEAMLRQVKRTFKPEFINRLSGTVVFHDMDQQMAGRILDKKLGELQQKLTAKHITMTLTDEARALLLSEGFTRDYGAREMDRAINRLLRPLLMRDILFGSLRQGGNVTVEAVGKELKLRHDGISD
ncbi:MAG: AAA family ATPase [Prevotella sp.]|nr:AAA family ATPase [Prevotella sp.]